MALTCWPTCRLLLARYVYTNAPPRSTVSRCQGRDGPARSTWLCAEAATRASKSCTVAERSTASTPHTRSVAKVLAMAPHSAPHSAPYSSASAGEEVQPHIGRAAESIVVQTGALEGLSSTSTRVPQHGEAHTATAAPHN